MSNVKKCDLCKSIYDPIDVIQNYKNYDSYEGVVTFGKMNDSKIMFHIDVCPKCFEPFYYKFYSMLKETGYDQ